MTAVRPETGSGQTGPGRSTLMWMTISLWAVVYAAWTMDWVLQPMDFALERALRRIPVCLVGAGLSLALGPMLRPLSVWSAAVKTLAAAALCAVAALVEAGVSQAAFYVIAPRWGGASLIDGLASAMLIFWVYAAWSALYFALAADAAVRGHQAHLARVEADLVQARHAALLRQIEPHFLFNALNTLSGLVMEGDAAGAETVILALSALMRDRLKSEPVAFHSLGEELALQQAYLAVQSARFPGRLKVVDAVPAALHRRQVPAHILQPLIENVFTHGVAHAAAPVTLTLGAEVTGEGMRLSVSDDAPRDTSVAAGGSGLGVGLDNVRDRLSLLYGARGQLQAGPAAPRGWLATVDLP